LIYFIRIAMLAATLSPSTSQDAGARPRAQCLEIGEKAYLL
jgi:hypothetical protein